MFYLFFKSLAEKGTKVTVELKNNIEITGSITLVDPNLNFYLTKISVKESEKYPQFVCGVINARCRSLTASLEAIPSAPSN